MAILKQRIKKKNTSGTYDTLHIETNSNLVLMNNGNTLEYEMYNHIHEEIIPNIPTGEYVIFSNREWLVAHRDGDKMYLVLRYVDEYTTYGSKNIYSGSALANKCLNFQNAMSPGALAKCIDSTLGEVTQKVHVPHYGHFNGGFSWFNSNERRIGYNISGTAMAYWTSSPYAGNNAIYVLANGGLSANGANATTTFGFRPYVCYVL